MIVVSTPVHFSISVDRGVYKSLNFQPQAFIFTHPFLRNMTPSACSKLVCSCQWGAVLPWLFTTRWHGRLSAFVVSCSMRPTSRACRGMPMSQAICPYVITFPRGMAAITAYTSSLKWVRLIIVFCKICWVSVDKSKTKSLSSQMLSSLFSGIASFGLFVWSGCGNFAPFISHTYSYKWLNTFNMVKRRLPI